ncbi:MAG: sulfur carrier protein [Moorella sp. (in: firmicutes)]|jgi:thiamine biosynthesis protein ThiS|uniref:sulfur carrier protein ThiS n=1 Tax=Moorella sp. E306M TaxID=2572683 RepID=UPI0010FFC60C|nr:sulfur carrier protein ThiS [Moorella sp. E306M]MDK2815745.1 sulfur carrier protein [Moorella sp. (in: firmicutes)]MDK2894307.1 sulfur carrier protein [Moorella sp. (in: firmicutes)]GEA17406.1 thiamine biosynthesis protein ThiS [Moorella sp. E306M]
MRLKVNGEERDVAAGLTVAELLQELGIDGRYMALERNRQVVPRQDYATTVLEEGDELEIIRFVGGG